MRQSASFNRKEIEWAGTVFSTLLRGGDAAHLMRSKEAAAVLSKFTMMRLRVVGRVPPRVNASRRDDLLTAQIAGLRWILGLQAIGKIVGVHPNTLRSRVTKWRRRMGAEYTPDAMAAEE